MQQIMEMGRYCALPQGNYKNREGEQNTIAHEIKLNLYQQLNFCVDKLKVDYKTHTKNRISHGEKWHFVIRVNGNLEGNLIM